MSYGSAVRERSVAVEVRTLSMRGANKADTTKRRKEMSP
jgi:hypothetical protein